MQIGTRLKISDTNTILESAEVVVTDTIREGRYLCQIAKLPETDKFKSARSRQYFLGGQVFVSDGQYEEIPQPETTKFFDDRHNARVAAGNQPLE